MRRDVNQGFKRVTKDPEVGGLADALRCRYGGNGASKNMYWVPLYEIPTTCGLAVNLTDKNISGRKPDVLDCTWL